MSDARRHLHARPPPAPPRPPHAPHQIAVTVAFVALQHYSEADSRSTSTTGPSSELSGASRPSSASSSPSRGRRFRYGHHEQRGRSHSRRLHRGGQPCTSSFSFSNNANMLYVRQQWQSVRPMSAAAAERRWALRSPYRFDPPPVPTGVVPATAPASRAQPRPPSGGQEQCMIFNDKGRCFRGPRCPYTHSCLFCGGPHAKRVCPALRTGPGASNLNPTTAPFNAMLRRTRVHSSATTASFRATSRYLPTLLVGSTPHA